MAIKKSELYSSLWKSCDELRGGMDASQYKDYVLTLLFIKYVSDQQGKEGSLIDIPPGGHFADLVALRGDKEIGDKINKAIGKLAESNGLKGVIDIADFNDEDKLGKGKDMQDCLTKLVSIFNDLDFRNNRVEGDDLLGDAYEYLMRHFATESGKSKGQFYTPAEVSRIMAKVIGIGKDTRQNQTVYDPACGSGSLLLKASDEAPSGLTIYGQEKDIATTALAKMNMILHNQVTATYDIINGNTLSNPHFKEDENPNSLKRFDFIVANPPFSTKSWDSGFARNEYTQTIFDPYGRFDYGVPPTKNGDYAFFLHIIHSLKSNGKGAVILPHGVLFRSHAEASIRKEAVKRGYIKGIIGLPANLFYGTGIPACIIVLDKSHATSRKGIFMINASKGFIKDGNKNRLREQDIHKIVDVFNKVIEIEGFSRSVPLSEIADPKNDYSLNLPRYIDSGEEADTHDLTAHLKGGIPKRDIDDLQRYWNEFTATREALFKQNGSTDYLIARVSANQVKTKIMESHEYQAFAHEAKDTLIFWKDKHGRYLKSLKQGCKPKEVIWNISEDLLATVAVIPLIDKYDIYQLLMNYWSDVMQDDVYQISSKGWEDAAKLHPITDEKHKNKKIKETPDIVIGSGKKTEKFKAYLIPPALIVQRYYAQEKQAIDKLETQRETLAGEIDALIEENSGEEGLLEEAKNDKGNLTKTSLIDRMRAISTKNNGKREIDNDNKEEWEVLVEAEIIFIKENALASEIKSKQIELNKKIVSHYAKLSVEDIKELVVIDKWFARLSIDVAGEVERVTHTLANRVKELEERYAHPMPELTEKVSKFSERVEAHLKKMGLEL